MTKLQIRIYQIKVINNNILLIKRYNKEGNKKKLNLNKLLKIKNLEQINQIIIKILNNKHNNLILHLNLNFLNHNMYNINLDNYKNLNINRQNN